MIVIFMTVLTRFWGWSSGMLGARIWLLAALVGAGLLAWIAGSLIGIGREACEARHALTALAAKQQDEAENRTLRAGIAERDRAYIAELTTLKERNDELEKALSAIKPSLACFRCRIPADELRLLNR
jgi:hypothetical protein